jgi:hypothetical protein
LPLRLLIIAILNIDDKDRAADVWKSCGGMLDHDNFFLAPEQLRKADCTIYTIKQREGDFVLVPPESPHQVINMVRIFIQLDRNF